jgi:hypothetical protein
LESRWGRLITHAFRTGALDFTQYHRDDAYWELREELALDDIEMEFASKLSELVMFWHSCAGQPTGWGDDDKRVNWHMREANKVWKDIGRYSLPWYDLFKEVEKSIEQLWKEFKEREKDPEYAAELKRDRQRLTEIANQFKSDAKSVQQAVDSLRNLRNKLERERRK